MTVDVGWSVVRVWGGDENGPCTCAGAVEDRRPPTPLMPDEMLHEIGGFEPSDAKKVLAGLEQAGIPFEIEADHHDLLAPGRTLQMSLGMYPTGSKLVIFVPESQVSRAQEIIAGLFPV